MAIPAQIGTDISNWTAATVAAAPLSGATPILKAALVVQGAAIISEVATAITNASGSLDLTDPTGFPGNFASYLMGLANCANDQAALVDIRGIVGRAVFNLGLA